MKELFSSITGALSGKILPWLIGLAVIAAGAFVVISKNRDAKLVETGRDAGSAGAVVAGQRDILDQVERANNAEQEITRSTDADRLARCLRNATPDTRANCGRFGTVPD